MRNEQLSRRQFIPEHGRDKVLELGCRRHHLRAGDMRERALEPACTFVVRWRSVQVRIPRSRRDRSVRLDIQRVAWWRDILDRRQSYR